MIYFYSLPFSKDNMKQQTRAMLDTNTYEALYRRDLQKILKLIESGCLIVYGCQLIRNELRDIPKGVQVDGKSFRNVLLSIYDQLTKNHDYPVEALSETLAEEYWIAYKGKVLKTKIFPDFIIVAVASIHSLDVIVSEDNKTMKSKDAVTAYEKINQAKLLKTPKFISLEKLV